MLKAKIKVVFSRLYWYGNLLCHKIDSDMSINDWTVFWYYDFGINCCRVVVMLLRVYITESYLFVGWLETFSPSTVCFILFIQFYAMPSSPLSPVDNGVGLVSSLAQSISKPTRSMSTSSGGSYSSEPSTPCSMYPKAPGSERSERSGSREDDQQVSRETIYSGIALLGNCKIHTSYVEVAPLLCTFQEW